MASTSEEKPAAPFGELVYAGGTDWSMLGRTGGKMKGTGEEDENELFPNLALPHRLGPLVGVKITFIAGGPAAVHCLAVDADGRAFTWGRNEKGQLGHGDLVTRNKPTVVAALANKHVVSGAGGRHHSVFVLKEGESYACGLNSHGQLGFGIINKKVKEDLQLAPVKVLVTGCSQAVAGIDFSLWRCGGKVYSAGTGQYGVLGDGSDHSYNAKDSSIQIVHDGVPTPKLITALDGHNITNITAGQQHAIAVDDKGNCFTWGNGGYGRLGHKVQRDEHTPKRVEYFSGRMGVPTDAVIAAGGTSSFCSGPGGQMYSWGKLKTSGDNQTYPTPMMDLSGWHVRSFACGPATYAVAADSSVITWGAATNGELGYGHGKKSSANPGKCEALEGGVTLQVAGGVGFTLFLLDPSHPKLAGLQSFESKAPDTQSVQVEEDAGKGKGKRKAEPAKAKGGKKVK